MWESMFSTGMLVNKKLKLTSGVLVGFARESLGFLHILHSSNSHLQRDFGGDELDSVPKKLNSSGGSDSERVIGAP